VHLLALAAHALWRKSPVPDLLAICWLLGLLLGDASERREYVQGALAFLFACTAFDGVDSSQQAWYWLACSERLESFDGGTSKSCGIVAQLLLCVQVSCKLLEAGCLCLLEPGPEPIQNN